MAKKRRRGRRGGTTRDQRPPRNVVDFEAFLSRRRPLDDAWSPDEVDWSTVEGPDADELAEARRIIAEHQADPSRQFVSVGEPEVPPPRGVDMRTLFASTPVVLSGDVSRQSVCSARAERKRVMFATGKAGKRGQRTPRWTALSRLICKRSK